MTETPPFKKIVCLGDSIICNWHTPSFVDDWQQLVDEKWGSGAVEIVNAGINGEIAQDGYYRLDRDVVAHQPDLVLIMFGHNDSDPPREISPVLFANYIRKILNYLQHSLPETTLWLLTPNQVADAGQANRYIPYLEQLILAAEDKRVKLIDLWHVFEGHNLDDIFTYEMRSTYIRPVGKDWLHPNEVGAKIIAEKLMNQLEEAA